MKKLIVGNWKMHLNRKEALALAEAVSAATVKQAGKQVEKQAEIVICPPVIWLSDVYQVIENKYLKLGAQDCRAEIKGAFTGDVSAAMIHDSGAEYVIVGHSERRKHHNENNSLIRSKAESVMENGMIPIICIGETEEERQSGLYEQVIATQLQESVPKKDHEKGHAKGHYVLAYEPVWAIGTGKTASVEDITAMHLFIHDWINRNRVDRNEQTCILYGGSVKASNACEILAIKHVGGVLVGGASLDATEFGSIAQSCPPQGCQA